MVYNESYLLFVQLHPEASSAARSQMFINAPFNEFLLKLNFKINHRDTYYILICKPKWFG